MLLNKLKMELLGSFLISFFIGTSAINTFTKANSIVGYSVQIFFLYMVMTWTAKRISGAQFNPIITISLMISQHVQFRKGLYLIIFQIFGTIFGACVAKTIQPIEILNLMEQKKIFYGIQIGVQQYEAFLYELIGGFFLVFVYYTIVLEKNQLPFVDGVGMGGFWFFSSLSIFTKTGAQFDFMRGLIYYILQSNSAFPWYYSGSIIGGLLGGVLGSQLQSETAMERKKRLKNEKRYKIMKAKMNEAAEQ